MNAYIDVHNKILYFTKKTTTVELALINILCDELRHVELMMQFHMQ